MSDRQELKDAVDACLSESSIGNCVTLENTYQTGSSNGYGPIGDWDTSKVTDMNDMFWFVILKKRLKNAEGF